MSRIFLPAVIALASLLPSVGLADTVKLRGCRGMYEVNTGRIYCVGDCDRVCAEVIPNVYPSGPFPDQVTTYDLGILTFQSECIFLGTNQRARKRTSCFPEKMLVGGALAAAPPTQFSI